MMASKQNKIDVLTEIIESSLLPELNSNIGDIQIVEEHFGKFRETLNINLHLFFDNFHENNDEIFQFPSETDENFKIKFILLLCEQSAENIVYKSNETILINQLNRLIEKYFQQILFNHKRIYDKVLKYYKSKLNANVWKRNLGAIHGYRRFSQLYYDAYNNKFSIDDIMFMLSVGTILIEFYDPEYKEIGLDLYLMLLTKSNKSDILSCNIHQAIFKHIETNLLSTKEQSIKTKLLQCVQKYFEYDTDWKNVTKWNRLDDIMDIILRNIIFESDSLMIGIYYNTIAIFSLMPTKDLDNVLIQKYSNWREIDNCIRNALNAEVYNDNYLNIEKLRSFYLLNQQTTCYHMFRSIKKLLKCLVHQTYRIGDENSILFKLLTLHILYITTIFPIDINLMSDQIYQFFTDFPEILLNLANSNKGNNLIMLEIRNFFETIILHIERDQMKLSNQNENRFLKRLETFKTIKELITD